MPESIRAPHCFAIQELGQGRIGLWLEDLGGSKSEWTIADYGQAAYDLGRFNGTYLTGQPIPDYPWLSQQWLSGWIERTAPFIPIFQQNLDHLWVKRMWPPDVAEKLLQLWVERDFYFKVLAQLPQTLCHMDAFRGNLFICPPPAKGQEVVAIDWAYVGSGAIGEELAPLIEFTILLFEVDLSDALELEKQVFAGYVAGLESVGWQGDIRQVRLGHAIAASFRYTVGPISVVPRLLDEQDRARAEQNLKKPMGEICDSFAEIRRHVTNRFPAQARELARELGLA